jgi:hypothetical protein
MLFTSIKAFTPPSAGDRFLHPKLGMIKLRSRAGGNSWWATREPGSTSYRFEVQPAKLQRVQEPEPGSALTVNQGSNPGRAL